ncbi:hypothetical protein [Acidovorax sp. NCPPB 4044]|uniref:hypothetical protein n=1 Tax=Acidovorax sp. NCPPB 4044 TaxID=2940490 RepID=UPI00230286CA|nr:hypothetical protein [Acidovorax sp. NCPPB 4044]MDA8522416.1 hypothetical protein [Acidovorax sp. NCPPB 4044]
MKAVESYKKYFLLMEGGDALPFMEFIDEVRAGKVSLSEVDELVEYIVSTYEIIPARLQAAVLLSLFQIDEDVGCSFARKEISRSVEEFKVQAEYLHKIVSIMLSCRGIKESMPPDDYDKNMKIAFAFDEGVDVQKFLKN